MPNKFNFDKVIQKFDKLKQSLPKEIGNESVKFFRDTFRRGGFQDGMGINKWKEVKRRIPGTNAYKYPKKKGLARRTRAILVKSGTLKRGIRMAYVSFNRTVIINDVKYAAYHNNGTSHIPQRQSVGTSRMLDLKVNTLIRKRVGSIFT